MEQLTVKDFETRLKNAGENAAFKDCHLSFAYVVSQENCKSTRLTFENCEFSKGFEIKDIGFELGITFTECTFNENLIIQRVEINDNYIDPRIDYRSISLLVEKCKFSKSLAINTVRILRDFTIIESTIYELIISGLVSKEGGFNIKNSTVEYYVTLEQCVLANSIKFITVTCKDSLRFSNNDTLSYSFEKNTFYSDSWIWYGKLKEGVSFHEGVYNKAFIVESVDANGYLSFSGAKFESTVSIAYECKNGGRLYRYGCPKIYLRDSEFNYGLFINGKRFSEDNFPIEKIDIHLSQLMKGEINIDGCDIADLTINGANYNCNLVLNNNRFDRITFNRLTNLSTINILNSTANFENNNSHEFRSINSQLGRTNLTSFSFEGFENIEINDSNFSEIITANVRWFDPEKILKKSKDCKDFGENRDLFRQLKYSMLKQGDRVQALFFKRYEMQALRKQLLLMKGHTGEKAMLWMNGSNDHGQSWIKPMMLGLLFTCLFYSLFIISTAPELTDHFSLSTDDLVATLKVIPMYFQIALKFLNPTHTYSSLDSGIRDNIPGNLFDIVQRIVISYFIFQTISAFRKYIKE